MERETRLFIKESLSAKKGVHKRLSLSSADFFLGSPNNKWKSLQKIALALPCPLQEALSPSTNEGTLCVCPPLTKTSLCYSPLSSCKSLHRSPLSKGLKHICTAINTLCSAGFRLSWRYIASERIAVACSVIEHYCINHWRIIVNKTQKDRSSSAQSAYWFEL